MLWVGASSADARTRVAGQLRPDVAVLVVISSVWRRSRDATKPSCRTPPSVLCLKPPHGGSGMGARRGDDFGRVLGSGSKHQRYRRAYGRHYVAAYLPYVIP